MFENETRHASGIRTGLSNGRGIVGGTAIVLAGLLTQSLAYGQVLPTNVHPELSPLLGQCPEMVDPDNEFAGNGPAVDINTQYYTTPDRLEAILEVYFRARETVSDWSEARERPSMKYKARGVAPTGCTILSSINSGTYSAWSYVDADFEIDPSPVLPTTDLGLLAHMGIDIGAGF